MDIYTSYSDYNRATKAGRQQIRDATLADKTNNRLILMSASEFVNGGKNIMGVPVCITPDGMPPALMETEAWRLLIMR